MPDPLRPSEWAPKRGAILLVEGDPGSRLTFENVMRRLNDLTLLVARGGATVGFHMAVARRPRLDSLDRMVRGFLEVAAGR